MMKCSVNVCNIFLQSLVLTFTLALASAFAQSDQVAVSNASVTSSVTSSPLAVRNPSFEQQDDMGFAQNWQFRPDVTSLDDIASDGERSLRIDASQPSSFFSRQPLALAPDTRYILRARVRTDNVTGTGAGFRVILGDARVQSERLRGDHDWRILEERFTTPDTLDSAFLDLIWDVDSGTIWYDELELLTDDGTFARTPASLARSSFDMPNVAIRRPEHVPIGVFQSGAELGGLAGFEMMVTRLQAAGMDSAIVIERSQSQALFDSADATGFNLILMPNFELDRSWWADEFPTTLEQAQAAASAIIDNLQTHSSLLAYAIVDEPSNRLADKVCALTDAFRELDDDTPVTGVFVGLNRGDLIFRDCQPDILLIDLYPFKEESAVGDFGMRGFGYNNLDYIDYIRRYTRFKTPEQPLWVLLQTHKTDWPDYKLREPTPAELRAMNWLAVGEGASGFFYFHWTSAQTWRGLADNPALLAEVGDFSKRVRALAPLLLNWHKTDDAFFVADAGRNDDSDQFAYTSTFSTAQVVPAEGELSAQAARENLYVLLVNRDVTAQRTFTLEMLPTLAAAEDVELLNAETGALQNLTEPITLAAGDAALFQVFLSGLEQAIARHDPTADTADDPTTPETDVTSADTEDDDTASTTDTTSTSDETTVENVAEDVSTETANSDADTDVVTHAAESDAEADTDMVEAGAEDATTSETASDSDPIATDSVANAPVTTDAVANETSDTATNDTADETPSDNAETTPDDAPDTASEDVFDDMDDMDGMDGASNEGMQADTSDTTDTNIATEDNPILAETATNPIDDDIDSDIVSTVRESTVTEATLVALPADVRRAKTIDNGSVPFYPIDWNQPVDVWWEGHPLNPTNGGFDPDDVVHPQPRVNVCDYQQGSQTGGILEALNALPIAGGTLWLPEACGPYVMRTPLEWLQDRYSHQGQINILRRSNLHFLSDGARIVSQPSGRFESDESTLLNFKSMEMQDGRREGDPERNVYFENLVFDGANNLHQALSFDGVRDVYIYNVGFENFIFTRNKHPGVIRAAIQSDNLWCIRCRFDSASHAIYIDGSHNSGVIDSTFTGGYRNAILLLTNDDTAPFSEQQRSVQYYVIANNHFDFESGSIIQMAAANTLVTDNVVRGSHRHFVGIDGKWSGTLRDRLIYDYYGNIIQNNIIEGSLAFFVEVSGWNRGDFRRYNIGDVTVTGNYADDVRTILNLRTRHPDALIDGITLDDNTFDGVREEVRSDSLGTVANVNFMDNTISYAE